MLDRQSLINVVCPNCGKKFKESIGRLQEKHVFRHTCGAFLESDLNELDKFLREKAQDALAYLQLRLRPPERDR